MAETNLAGAGTGALEGFQKLAEGSQGAACVMVIKQVLKHPQIYVFGELLELKNIQDLHTDAECKPYLDLLRLFAYGTYADYKKQQSTLPALGQAETTKLKQLSIVTLSAKEKTLHYDALLAQLEMGSVRQLEDLIIDSIYQGLLKGQLDQNRSVFEVQYSIGRDIGPSDVQEMMGTLEQWMKASAATQRHLEKQIKRAEDTQEAKTQETADLVKKKEDVITAIRLNREQGDSDGGLGGLMGEGMGMMGNLMGMLGPSKARGKPRQRYARRG